MASDSKAKTMGAFLKSRRERLLPKDVGFPNGKRKTPGLRREEVAVLAGVSVTYYTWLEQGRELNASRDVIESIAQALRLSSDERSHLIQLWNPHVFNTPPAVSTAVNPQLRMIIDQVNYPSYITNERTEILAWNAAANKAIADFSSIPVKDRYFIRLLFEDMEVRRRIINIEEFARYAVCVFRTYYDKYQDDPWFEETVKHLIKNSSEFDQMWKTYDIQLKKVNRIIIQPSEVKETVAFDIKSLSDMADNPDIHICIYTPVTKVRAVDS